MISASGQEAKSGIAAAELDRIGMTVDAVCAELGLKKGERARRRAVEERIMAAYRRGRRQPLNLVDAGLDG